MKFNFHPPYSIKKIWIPDGGILIKGRMFSYYAAIATFLLAITITLISIYFHAIFTAIIFFPLLLIQPFISTFRIQILNGYMV